MSENLLTGTPDFNWEEYAKGQNISGLSHDVLEQTYNGTLNKVSSREVVIGTVISINKREVIVDINYKQDAIIPISEFRYNPDLKVGDQVEVYIENLEDKFSQAHPPA
jgi:small subunit ribosomal protein S1